MALIVFAVVALFVATIWLAAMRLAVGKWGTAMRAVSPGLLPPLGIVFALIIGFLAAGVWGDSDKAKDAVSAEASALRSVVLLSNQLPHATATRMRVLVRRHIEDAVQREWPGCGAVRMQPATAGATLPAMTDIDTVETG